jgi:hypothetical protein
MGVNIGKIVQRAFGIAGRAIDDLLRDIVYVNVAGNPQYDPDTGKIVNSTSYQVKAIVSGYSAFEIMSQVAQQRDIRVKFALRDFPAGFQPTTNDVVIFEGQHCPVADWEEVSVKNALFTARAHRP